MKLRSILTVIFGLALFWVLVSVWISVNFPLSPFSSTDLSGSQDSIFPSQPIHILTFKDNNQTQLANTSIEAMISFESQLQQNIKERYLVAQKMAHVPNEKSKNSADHDLHVPVQKNTRRWKDKLGTLFIDPPSKIPQALPAKSL